MSVVNQSVPGYWSGHVLLYTDLCPEQPDAVFTRRTLFEPSHLLTDSITLRSGGEPLGEILHISRDDKGLHVLVELPQPRPTPQPSLVWSCAVDKDRIITEHKVDPEAGARREVVRYPIKQIYVQLSEEPSHGLSSPAVVIDKDG